MREAEDARAEQREKERGTASPGKESRRSSGRGVGRVRERDPGLEPEKKVSSADELAQQDGGAEIQPSVDTAPKMQEAIPEKQNEAEGLEVTREKADGIGSLERKKTKVNTQNAKGEQPELGGGAASEKAFTPSEPAAETGLEAVSDAGPKCLDGEECEAATPEAALKKVAKKGTKSLGGQGAVGSESGQVCVECAKGLEAAKAISNKPGNPFVFYRAMVAHRSSTVHNASNGRKELEKKTSTGLVNERSEVFRAEEQPEAPDQEGLVSEAVHDTEKEMGVSVRKESEEPLPTGLDPNLRENAVMLERPEDVTACSEVAVSVTPPEAELLSTELEAEPQSTGVANDGLPVVAGGPESATAPTKPEAEAEAVTEGPEGRLNVTVVASGVEGSGAVTEQPNPGTSVTPVGTVCLAADEPGALVRGQANGGVGRAPTGRMDPQTGRTDTQTGRTDSQTGGTDPRSGRVDSVVIVKRAAVRFDEARSLQFRGWSSSGDPWESVLEALGKLAGGKSTRGRCTGLRVLPDGSALVELADRETLEIVLEEGSTGGGALEVTRVQTRRRHRRRDDRMDAENGGQQRGDCTEPDIPVGVRNGIPEKEMPKNGTPGDRSPENGIPEKGVPENGIQDNGVPENGIQDNGEPENEVPENGVPENGRPERPLKRRESPNGRARMMGVANGSGNGKRKSSGEIPTEENGNGRGKLRMKTSRKKREIDEKAEAAERDGKEKVGGNVRRGVAPVKRTGRRVGERKNGKRVGK